MIEKLLAVLILALWLVKVNRFGWDKNVGPLKNIFFGCAVFAVMGLCYCVPMWLLFLR